MDYLKINKETWDKRTKTHITSEFYNVAGFIKGETSLREIELAELTQVKGKSLLHLQCHFGLDTLSWAREGAVVTGVDLSSEAIKQANILKQKTALDAKFICSDLYKFGEASDTQYDIVFTSYGSICWLPDINRWAEIVAKNLKPNGVFYMVDFHPVYDLISGYAYFHQDEADIEEEETYTENAAGEKHSTAVWGHPLSDIINALIKVGIRINHLNEFPFSPYNCFKDMIERKPGRFYMKNAKQDIPLVYSILGTKN